MIMLGVIWFLWWAFVVLALGAMCVAAFYALVWALCGASEKLRGDNDSYKKSVSDRKRDDEEFAESFYGEGE